MKTKQIIGILILSLSLTTAHAQEGSINCEYCIEAVHMREEYCINNLGVGCGEECKEYSKAKLESSESKYLFDEYLKRIKQCRNLIRKEECTLNAKECENILNRASDIFEYISAGECYVKFGQCEKAEEPYKKAMRIYEEKARDYHTIGMSYAKLAACYNLKDNVDKRKEYYKKAGYNYKKDADESLELYKKYPGLFDNDYVAVANVSARRYLHSARAYKAAEDYENACKSCQEANKYYKEINKSTIDCKKYGCEDAILSKLREQQIENQEKQNYDIALSITIILITMILSLIVIWYKKFKR